METLKGEGATQQKVLHPLAQHLAQQSVRSPSCSTRARDRNLARVAWLSFFAMADGEISSQGGRFRGEFYRCQERANEPLLCF